MNDTEHEDDLGRFLAEDDDLVKPIDMIGKSAPPPPPKPDPTPNTRGSGAMPVGSMTEPPKKRVEPTRKKQPPPDHVRSPDDGPRSYVHKGEYIDLIEKVPHLTAILAGAGWNHMALEDDPVDIDLSLFLLDKNGQTRIDDDFVFYNNDRACEGAIHHLMDSRTGAGDGDDEKMFIDLNGISFDIMKIVFVLSIYDPEIEGHHFGMVRDIFFRLVNKEDGEEILRYEVAEEDQKGGNAMIVGTLIREGPKWIFEVIAELSNGGLAKIATDYGIIVKELQSTAEIEDVE